MRPQLIMLCGPSCAGKSTARARFAEMLQNPLVLNTDDFIELWAQDMGSTYHAQFEQLFPVAERTYKELLAAALREHRNIVVDRTHVTVASRRKVLSQVPSEYFVTAVRVGRNVGLEELLRRAERRAEETGKEVPGEVIARMFREFEPPTLGERIDMVLDLVE